MPFAWQINDLFGTVYRDARTSRLTQTDEEPHSFELMEAPFLLRNARKHLDCNDVI